jgi:hypothetical protein
MTPIPRQRNVRGVLAGVLVVVIGAGGMAWSADDSSPSSEPAAPVVASD